MARLAFRRLKPLFHRNLCQYGLNVVYAISTGRNRSRTSYDLSSRSSTRRISRVATPPICCNKRASRGTDKNRLGAWVRMSRITRHTAGDNSSPIRPLQSMHCGMPSLVNQTGKCATSSRSHNPQVRHSGKKPASFRVQISKYRTNTGSVSILASGKAPIVAAIKR